jgi:hypothetical protein
MPADGIRVAGIKFVESYLERTDIEGQIREELAEAFDSLEHAAPEDRPRATVRLNRAVRQLYDFIGYGKLPQKWVHSLSAGK